MRLFLPSKVVRKKLRWWGFGLNLFLLNRLGPSVNNKVVPSILFGVVVSAVLAFLHTINAIRTAFGSEVVGVVLKLLPAVAVRAVVHLRASSLLVSGDLLRLVPRGAIDWVVGLGLQVSSEILCVMCIDTLSSIMTRDEWQKILFNVWAPNRFVAIKPKVLIVRH
jgi:hypothetical protein